MIRVGGYNSDMATMKANVRIHLAKVEIDLRTTQIMDLFYEIPRATMRSTHDVSAAIGVDASRYLERLHRAKLLDRSSILDGMWMLPLAPHRFKPDHSEA